WLSQVPSGVRLCLVVNVLCVHSGFLGPVLWKRGISSQKIFGHLNHLLGTHEKRIAVGALVELHAILTESLLLVTRHDGLTRFRALASISSGIKTVPFARMQTIPRFFSKLDLILRPVVGQRISPGTEIFPDHQINYLPIAHEFWIAVHVQVDGRIF